MERDQDDRADDKANDGVQRDAVDPPQQAGFGSAAPPDVSRGRVRGARRAGTAHVASLWRLRVEYWTADVSRRLVLAHALVHDLAQEVVLGPGRVFDFRDQPSALDAKQRVSAFQSRARPAISAVNGPAAIELRCGSTSRDKISHATDRESEECRST